MSEQRLAVTIRDAAAMLGLSVALTEALVDEGDIPSLWIQTEAGLDETIIAVADLRQWLDRQIANQKN